MRNWFMVKYFVPLESPKNKNINFLLIFKKNISSCHTSDTIFLTSNFSQTTVYMSLREFCKHCSTAPMEPWADSYLHKNPSLWVCLTL